MTATITPKMTRVKEPSIETLAKQKAKGGRPNPNTGAKPPLGLAETLVRSMRERAGNLAARGRAILPDDDYALVEKVAGGIAPTNAEVVTLMVLFERHASLAKSKPANGHPALTGTTTPAGIAANDRSATGTTTEHVRGNGKPQKVDVGDQIVELPIGVLQRHPDNRHPTKEAIDKRAESMQAHGQLEPIVVRPIHWGPNAAGETVGKGEYQILSGETRWLAAKKLGRKTIDARIRKCDDTQALEYLAEANAARDDLNPIEKARLIERLCQPIAEGGAGKTREQAGNQFGLKDGASASNLVRLLKLPKVWQDRVAAGELPESFARLLVPVVEALPHLKSLEDEWKQRDTPRDSWRPQNAFSSRALLDEAIDEYLHQDLARCDIAESFDLADEKIRKQLGVIEIELPTGAKGKLEKALFATNVKAYDQLERKQREQTAKKSAEKAGRDDPAPKRKRTPAEEKANAAKQAKLLVHRREVWRHEWLKALVAERLEDQDWQTTKLLCWVITRMQHWIVQRSGHWPDKMDQALKQAGGRGGGWRGIASLALTRFSPAAMRQNRTSQRSFQLDEVLRDFLRLVVLAEDRDTHQPLIPHEVLDSIAADYGIDLDGEWRKLQESEAGKQRLEQFFLQHQTQQLGELALELKVFPMQGATRGAIVKLLMSTISGSTTRRLPLPKCIKALAVAGGKKGKGRK